MRPPLEPGLADPAKTSNLRRVPACAGTQKSGSEPESSQDLHSRHSQQDQLGHHHTQPRPSPAFTLHRPICSTGKQKFACPYLPNGLLLTELLARCAGTSLLLQGRDLIQVVLHMISSVGQGDQLRIQMLQENLQAKSSVTLQPGFRGTSAGKREYLLPEPPAQSGSQGREEGGGERGEGERS